ncbi:hypothetical protein COOONC_08434 [Cooperia oncophora]
MALNVLHRRNREMELTDFKWLDLVEKLKMDSHEVDSYSLHHVPSSVWCHGCFRLRRRVGFDTGDVNGDSAERSIISLRQTQKLVRQFQTSRGYHLRNHLLLAATKSFELGVSRKMLTHWEQYLRRICSKYYKENPPIVGGPGVTVEIDETNVTRRKYNRGRLVRRKEWLFGGIERGSGRVEEIGCVADKISPSISSVPHLHSTLTSIILKFIRPGTTIMSDSWRAYSQLSRLPAGYRHLTVNHMLHFVDPLTGAHTQNIESLWQKFKMIPKKKFGLNTKRYSHYIKEFLWRREFGKPSEIIFNFFEHVARLYPC